MTRITVLLVLGEGSPRVRYRLEVENPGDLGGKVFRHQRSQMKSELGWQFVGVYDTCQFLDAMGNFNKCGYLRAITMQERQDFDSQIEGGS